MERANKLFSHPSAEGLELEPFDFRSEAVLQGYIEENPKVLLSFKQGDDILIKGLETPWVRDKNAGRIDFLVDFGDSYGVVELKKGTLDEKALEQLMGYLSDAAHLKKAAKEIFEDDNPDSVKWEGVLVGTSLSDNLLTKVEEYNLKNASIPISVIELKRFRSGGQIYVTTESYYPQAKGKKDYSTYLVNGKTETNKSRSVLTMVRDYVNRNPDTTLDDLIKKIGAYGRRKSLPAIMELNEAASKANNIQADSSYYIGKDAVHLRNGDSVAVLGFWKLPDIPKVEKIASILDCKFEKI